MLRNKVFPQTVSLQRIGISDTSQCLGTWLVSQIPPLNRYYNPVKLVPLPISAENTKISIF